MLHQLHPDKRIHDATVEAPQVANVVPPHTRVLWEMPLPPSTRKGMNELVKKVCCLDAAGTVADAD